MELPVAGAAVLKGRGIVVERHWMCLQKGAGGLSFTMVCVPKGMHRCPRVRDNHMAAVL